MRVDGKPYRVQTRYSWRARLRIHRWLVEYWDGGDHGFQPFTFRRRATRWAERQDGIR